MQIFADYNILQLSPSDLNCTNDTSFLTKTTANTGNDKRFSNSSGIICIGIVTARISSTTGGYVFTGVCLFGGGGTSARTRTEHPSPCPSPLARTMTGYPPPPSRKCHGQDTARAVRLLRFHSGGLSCCLSRLTSQGPSVH